MIRLTSKSLLPWRQGKAHGIFTFNFTSHLLYYSLGNYSFIEEYKVASYMTWDSTLDLQANYSSSYLLLHSFLYTGIYINFIYFIE